MVIFQLARFDAETSYMDAQICKKHVDITKLHNKTLVNTLQAGTSINKFVIVQKWKI